MFLKSSMFFSLSFITAIAVLTSCNGNQNPPSSPSVLAKQNRTGPSPSQFLDDDRSLTIGNNFACAIKEDQTISCWGRDQDFKQNFPHGIKGFTQITAGTNHICGLFGDGSAYCWGAASSAAQIPNGLAPFKTLTSGDKFTCGISASDKLGYCWGFLPKGVSNLISAKELISLSAGQDHVCAVSSDNKVECYGDGSHTKNSVPHDLHASKVSTGIFHSVAVMGDEVKKTWGSNANSYNGLPHDLGKVGMVSAGNDITCVVLINGAPWCWGDRYSTQTIENKLSNQKDGFISISTAIQVPDACGIKMDGKVACFGYFGTLDSVPTDLGKVYLP